MVQQRCSNSLNSVSDKPRIFSNIAHKAKLKSFLKNVLKNENERHDSLTVRPGNVLNDIFTSK